MEPSPRDGLEVQPPEAPLALEEYVPFRISVLANRMTRAVAAVYGKRFRLSAPEWRTMAVLGRYGALSGNSVVERTAMDKVRVSRTVAKLVTSGLITRRSDPEDRRRAILDLTPKGVAGRTSPSMRSATAAEMTLAANVSVPVGRCGPCCSTLPAGMITSGLALSCAATSGCVSSMK